LKAGFHPVFFGDTLFGSRLPNLTYMLSFENSAELEAKWDIFRNDPDWKSSPPTRDSPSTRLSPTSQTSC